MINDLGKFHDIVCHKNVLCIVIITLCTTPGGINCIVLLFLKRNIYLFIYLFIIVLVGIIIIIITIIIVITIITVIIIITTITVLCFF